MDKNERTFRQVYPQIMSNILNEGKSGNFELKKKVVHKGTLMRMYNFQKGCHYYYEYPCDYPIITLLEKGEIWMSDTPYEIDCIRPAIDVAHGNCLVSGLGIGLLPKYLSMFNLQGYKSKPITHMDIVELNQEVIDLVYPQLRLDFKTNMIKGNIWEYLKTTEEKYDFIHIDIWGDICATIQEVDRAIKESKRCLKPNGITRAWLMELYMNIKNKLPKTPQHSNGKVGFYEPCLICGKKLRNDYAGLCMDCADSMGLSEYFIK